MDKAIERFNVAATELQSTAFRLPRTPAEWRRMHQNPPKRDYHKLLNAAVPMIDAFCSTDSSEERSGVASKLNQDALGILRTFADRMAVLAYRRQSPVLIQQGLTALAILGEVDDVRDLTFYLATLHYSALKLGMDARKVFYEAASLSPSALLQGQMRDFPLRPPSYTDLSAFKLREVTTDEGFDFVQDSWDPPRVPRWQFWKR
jgi:hypothetical protein